MQTRDVRVIVIRVCRDADFLVDLFLAYLRKELPQWREINGSRSYLKAPEEIIRNYNVFILNADNILVAFSEEKDQEC
jgi:hypothetical protein